MYLCIAYPVTDMFLMLHLCREGKGKKAEDEDIDWGTLKPGKDSLLSSFTVT